MTDEIDSLSKECCKCGRKSDIYPHYIYEHKIYCEDCLLKELGLYEATVTYYTDGGDVYEDMSEVCKCFGVDEV